MTAVTSCAQKRTEYDSGKTNLQTQIKSTTMDTATFGAGVVAQVVAFLEDEVHKGDNFWGEVFSVEGQSQSVNQDAADQQDF